MGAKIEASWFKIGPPALGPIGGSRTEIRVSGAMIGGSGAKIGSLGAKIETAGFKIGASGARIGGSGAKIQASGAKVALRLKLGALGPLGP